RFSRFSICVLLLGCWLLAQDQSFSGAKSQKAMGMFYVDGIVYQYSVGQDCMVVAAAHSAINRKFAAVKVRVYNTGGHTLTIRPEDVQLEDGFAGRAVMPVSG